jgi:hypothetical protein
MFYFQLFVSELMFEREARPPIFIDYRKQDESLKYTWTA